MMHYFLVLVATGLGTGFSPKAPGTVGTLVAIPLALAAYLLPFWARVVIFFVLFFLGVYAAGYYSRETEKEDPSEVVIDEIAACYLVYILFDQTVMLYVFGFILFRIFDIVKPFPVNLLENLPGGWGIMADDVMAAVYSILCYYLIVGVIL